MENLVEIFANTLDAILGCLLYTSQSPRDY